MTSNQSSVTGYRYNGLGDRLQETVNGVTTTFTMDLNTGLTQALSDGTHDYLYGAGRIAQIDLTPDTGAPDTLEYFLGDALGSVRQLTDSSGAVTLARTYDPYGTVNTTSGAGSSGYGFTNEYQSQGLIYLRARMYSPANGRFLTRDTWSGSANRPLSFNRWGYVEGNPVNRIDPTGRYPSDYYGDKTLNPLLNLSSRFPQIGFSFSSVVCEANLSAFPVYDLTTYLALAMTAHGADPRVEHISNLVDFFGPISQANFYNPDVFLRNFVEGYLQFNQLEGGKKVWDIKVEIDRILGKGVFLCAEFGCRWVDYSTPGNIHFGYVAHRAKIDQGIAAIAGGALEIIDGLAKIKEGMEKIDVRALNSCMYELFSTQYGSVFKCDNPDDQRAVDFGYKLGEKYPNGISGTQLRAELGVFGILNHFQSAPVPAPYLLFQSQPNPYGPDHFNHYK